MNNEELFAMLGDTEDALLEKAEHPSTPQKIHWKRYAGIAACLLLCACGAAWFLRLEKPAHLPQDSTAPTVQSTAPSDDSVITGALVPTEQTAAPTEDTTEFYNGLPVLEVTFDTGGMGFEGYEFYDISELKSENPWHEDADLQTLPVFENYHAYDHASSLAHPAQEEVLLERLHEFAAAMNISFDDSAAERHTMQYGALTLEDIVDKFPSREEAIAYIESGTFYMLTVNSGSCVLEADVWGNARISYNPSVNLPQGAGFGHHDAYEVYVKAAEYFQDEYLDGFGMEQPTACVEGGDYNIYGEVSHSLHFYDAAGDLTEQILHYNFDTVRIACDDVRQLMLIEQKRIDRSHKVGDYPILTVEEAKAAFAAGDYLSTVPEEYCMDTPEAAYVELIYRTGNSEKYYLPYYRIYAEISPDFERTTAVRNYGAFYVPAVRPEYLKNAELWDGRFN